MCARPPGQAKAPGAGGARNGPPAGHSTRANSVGRWPPPHSPRPAPGREANSPDAAAAPQPPPRPSVAGGGGEGEGGRSPRGTRPAGGCQPGLPPWPTTADHHFSTPHGVVPLRGCAAAGRREPPAAASGSYSAPGWSRGTPPPPSPPPLPRIEERPRRCARLARVPSASLFHRATFASSRTVCCAGKNRGGWPSGTPGGPPRSSTCRNCSGREAREAGGGCPSRVSVTAPRQPLIAGRREE